MNGDGGTAARRGFATRAVGYLAPSHLDEDEVLLDARTRGTEFGCAPIDPAEGAALRFLATALRARAVVEIGTGAGVSGQWLLRGMAPDGVLTSIDIEPEHQRAARAGFREAGYPSGRLRLINGIALEVLPRLADGAYDLVFADAATVEYPRYLDAAIRLLRPGGVVALCGVPTADELDSYEAGPEARALLEVHQACREDERLVPLPQATTGLLIAARTAAA
ncbi:O-methyltransferase [Pseudonocardia acaciae]|uniref:O-methyltransferase n=1 Tax=Pseudonocardia acaciae TaxID=551276 RepID=UPI000688BC68|nr:class I SAM-dependent methyltransferase [Pseudonocardia acaciae]